MEDIIAYSIIAILPVVVVYGAVLLRKLFVRRKQQKLKLRQEQLERQQERIESIAKQSRERERQRIEEVEAIAKTYGGGGVVGRQEYDLNTNTVRTSVRDPKTNHTRYVTTPAAQNVAPGTVLPQATSNSGTDLLTLIGLAGLANSIGSTPAYSKPSTDFGMDDSDSRRSVSSSFSSSDSSSSWSDSSDSGPSSDW
jgi:type II secretory pathway pseudopilin PulG